MTRGGTFLKWSTAGRPFSLHRSQHFYDARTVSHFSRPIKGIVCEKQCSVRDGGIGRVKVGTKAQGERERAEADNFIHSQSISGESTEFTV